MKYRAHNHAFSLVELSIVLVILGLLTGGILAGQSLIRAAELRQISTQRGLIVTATQTFRDKYFALPGDMTNATQFWGARHPTPATCRTNNGTGTQTCDGNGDGRITAGSFGEHNRFWQHLANAGLIEGQYDIFCFVAATCEMPGRISGTQWSVQTNGTPTAAANSSAYFNRPSSNILHLYKPSSFMFSGGNFINPMPFLKPEELWNIDTKMDDGMPARGKVFGIGDFDVGNGISTCATPDNNADLNATYNLASSSQGCSVIFTDQF